MKLLKVKVKTENKIEMFKKLYRVYSILKDVQLSDPEVSILAYYNVFGVSEKTDDFLFKTHIFNKRATLNNCKAKLRKQGLLLKPKNKNDLPDHLKLPVEPQIGMLIKFDNT